MPEIKREIEAYSRMQTDLEAHHLGKWVLVYDGQLVGAYDTFDAAAREAVAKFGKGPYLIQQVGAPPLVLPASVLYRPVNA